MNATAANLPPAIAYFLGTNNDWGGASRALLNFVRGLDRRAFSPIVVIPKRGPIQETLAAGNIRCLVWPIHERSRNIPAYVWQIGKAMAFLKDQSVDLLHINYGAIGWKPAEIIAARLLRLPIVTHLHTPKPKPSSYIRYSAAVVGVSRYVCEHSNAHGVPCHAVHNVADFRRFGSGTPKRDQLGLKEDSVVVGFLGQVRRIKGITQFLELPKRIPDRHVEFLIAGELRGEDAFTAAEFSRMIEGDRRIRYVGYREDVQDLYASCDIVVMPSQWEEPCAMVLFEASVAGKPIVATATGGTQEILVDSETGFLVQKDDFEALLSRVVGLISNPNLRVSMGLRARERASKDFTERPLRAMEELYRILLPHS